ncbi:MAG: lysine--tRNA ligase [Candidatus Thermoplasmatota archaeon]
MHWVDVIADEILRSSKEHVIASGTSISGEIHIGNAGDVIMAHGVAKAVEEKGGKAKLIWFADDVDPLRKIPMQVQFDKKYIGMPVSSLPCPYGCCNSFVSHYVKKFIDSLAKIGIEPKIKSGIEMYRNGEYDELIKIALYRAADIRKILKEISGSEKEKDWLPFDPICKNCGKIATTNAYKYENEIVKYRCTGGVAGRQRIDGCGYNGEAKLNEGKLTWRVEWAARWKLYNVSCEPFGKEHAASGGTYETSSIISKEIFNYKSPHPVIYEHILVGGRKMSKSIGNIITPEEFLNVAQPEIQKFFFFRAKATRHKDFDISKNLIHLIEDYEHVERLYYGIDKPSPQEDIEELKRAYVISQIKKPSDKFAQIPYRHLLTLVQIKKSFDEILHAVRDYAFDEEKLKKIIKPAKYWLENYAPDEFRFSIIENFDKEKLSEKQKKCLTMLAIEFDKIKWEAQEIHNTIHSCAKKNNLEPKQLFSAIYTLLIGKEKGPRMGYFLSSLEKSFVIGRLR